MDIFFIHQKEKETRSETLSLTAIIFVTDLVKIDFEPNKSRYLINH